MKVLVFGGRTFGLEKEECLKGRAFLERLAAEHWPRSPEDEYGNWLPDVEIVTGEARGADQIGIDWATINWTKYKGFPADWKTHKKSAGILRNIEMLKYLIDDKEDCCAVQFPGGKGTQHMRGLLDKAGVKVYEYVG